MAKLNKTHTTKLTFEVNCKEAKRQLKEVRKIINGINRLSLWTAIKWRIAGIKPTKNNV